MKAKTTHTYPLDFKTKFGFSTMCWVSQGCSSFMTSLFMLYLTDYSGIGALAVTLGTVLLLLGRVIDAVDDPLQGWIMDSARPTKFGKYKPFIIISTLLSAISVICLFAMPGAVAKNPVMVVIWVILFYLMYDIGASFYAERPLLRTLTSDGNVRAKLMVYPRVFGMLISVPFAFFMAMVEGLNTKVGNMHDSFAYMTLIIMIPATLISLLGVACVKEGKHASEEKDETKLTFKDIINMFKTNKALLVTKGAGLFSGFIWTLVFATTTYYIKCAYCADLTTGAVDSQKFATYTMIMGAMQMLPFMLAAVVSPWMMKKFFKEPVDFSIFSQLSCAVAEIAMFVCHLLGLLTPAVFFVLLFVVMFTMGLGFVPGGVLDSEAMDYGMWKTKKEVSGLCQAVGNFLSKAQSALSSALVGVILIAIGYKVDSVTDTYIGDLSAIPSMLIWFVVVLSLAPAALNIIASVILKFYPVKGEVKKRMYEELNN